MNRRNQLSVVIDYRTGLQLNALIELDQKLNTKLQYFSLVLI